MQDIVSANITSSEKISQKHSESMRQSLIRQIRQSFIDSIKDDERAINAKWNTWRFWCPFIVTTKEEDDVPTYIIHLNFNGIVPCAIIAFIIVLLIENF